MKYYLVAGEASGDLHASNLMQSLQELDRDADFRFFGGDLMHSKGGTLVKHYREMAYMGIIPVILHARTILRNLDFCKRDIAAYKPDVVILVDYPGFNLKVAKYVKSKLHIPVHYYISPKVWAWKEYRVKSFKKYVDEMFCILPFEVDFFRKHQYRVHYVGNPTVDAIADRDCREESFDEFIDAHRLENKPIIALLAGSRKQEIASNLPAMLEAVKSFADGYQILVAGAPGIEPLFYKEFEHGFPSVRVLFNRTYRILAQADAALVTSGTATLETALLNVPQVVCYRTSFPKLTWWGFKHILHTPFISLVNLISGREVVKELFAKRFTVDQIRTELKQLLHVQSYRQNMLNNYREMQAKLGRPGASDRAAAIIFRALHP
ncbi:MAG: lipid-A-disaccharide synthase [Bacteroidetes bacterium GWD2_45_23]|nr:MAG: lipid-A-disaccharide synthase [Bacteroidetes bacterium GWC2_46_850]OFX78996.1 MAG: lipid-A-disaccharide synthase [Bacteroidetes bacterium GWC1_47_7]OFX82962.1 MAG: lipid-A-disaccharide synthase [Bacteroidetes bacterium GWD2_45_23]HAR37703.1 lipid-A-disaccharide synthase [Porphyromonadaceae bacterium]HBA99894.1 lipid-A-disaccharide synthase [Porphyromonadaceae bacterium]